MFTTTGVTQRIARVRLQLLSNQSNEEFELEFDLEVCTGMGVAGIPQIPREYRGDGNGSCRDPAGTEFVFLREILQTIKVMVQALEYWVNCPVRCLTWLLNV